MRTVGVLLLILAVGVLGVVVPARAEKKLMGDAELDTVSGGNGKIGCTKCTDISLGDNTVTINANSGMEMGRIGATFGVPAVAGPTMVRGSHMESMGRTSSMLMINTPGSMVFVFIGSQ